jgi:phosphoglycolate phosphatase-like HAD superfamily hydrolase
LRTAATRGSQQLGRQLSECDTIVIGDTFHDVDAALEIGARAVCVGTSGIALDQLLARGARHVFETLADPRVLQVLLH